MAHQAGADRHRAGADHAAPSCRPSTPEQLAKTFGDPTYVSTDVPYRTQAEVDEAASSLAEEIAGTFAEFEGVARGNPKVRAGASISVDRAGRAVRRQVHRDHLPAPVRPGTGYTTSFSVTGRQNRSLLGLASGGGAGRAAPAGDRDRPGQRRRRPREAGPGQAAVPLAVRRLRQRLGADGAAGGRQGPRLDGAAGGRRRGAGLLRAGRLPPPGGARRALQRGGHGAARAGRPGRLRLRARSTGARWCPGSTIGWTCWTQDGKTEGVRVATTGDKLLVNLDHTKTTITVHADGKVLIEGTQGVTIDSAGSADGAQGRVDLAQGHQRGDGGRRRRARSR